MSIRCLAVLAFLVRSLNAQSCLVLSTAMVTPGGTAELDLTLTSRSELPPASLQWTFAYTSAIRSLTVNDGSAAAAAGKTVLCNETMNGYTCMVIGANAKAIADGTIARVTAVLAPDATHAVIQIIQTFGALSDGNFAPILAGNGTITTANVSPDRRLRPPLKRVSGGCQSAK